MTQSAIPAMPVKATPFTLLGMSGRAPLAANLAQACLVLIDYQNEYLEGPLTLPGAAAALVHAADLLKRARKAGTRIIHVVHEGQPGGMFDRSSVRGAIIPVLAPLDGEIIVGKPRPNSFSGTTLADAIGAAGTPLIVAGFMTHMCVSSTVRAALDLGYPVTLASDACTARDLPVPGATDGSFIDAATLHITSLAALSDRFACVVPTRAIV
jgi:nicotinamidase-related amidase